MMISHLKQVGWNGPIAIPHLILLFKYYAILRHHQRQQPYFFTQAISMTVVWVPLQILFHYMSNSYRGSLVNNWRSTLRSCASFSLCLSTLIEMACLHINYYLIPFSINIFLVIFSGAYIFSTFSHNSFTTILTGLWNAAALATLVWIVLLTDNENKEQDKIDQTANDQQHWLYFSLCLDFFSCPIDNNTLVSTDSNNIKSQQTTTPKSLPKNTNDSSTLFQKITNNTSIPIPTTLSTNKRIQQQKNTSGLMWHLICLMVFIIIIASQEEENNIHFWDFQIDLRIDSTFHHHYTRTTPTTIIQWTTLLFLLPVIIQTQKHIFLKITLPSIQAIDSINSQQQQQTSFIGSILIMMNSKPQQQNEIQRQRKLNVQRYGFIITFTTTCVLVLGLNATFYSPARLFILSIHAILQWTSHFSCLLSYIFSTFTAKLNNNSSSNNKTMLKP